MDEGQVNIRVFIEHATAFVGVRLGAALLHRRAYKQEHISGSLKPTVAAAMLEMAQVTLASWVPDPFCGAGAILIEASLRCVPAWGEMSPLPPFRRRARTPWGPPCQRASMFSDGMRCAYPSSAGQPRAL